MSFLYRQGKIWYFYWQQNEKKHGKSLGTESKEEANVLKGEEDKKLFSQRHGIAHPHLLWRTFKKDYLEYSKTKKRHGTYEKDRLVLDNFERLMVPHALTEITNRIVETFIQKIAARASKSTANLYYRHLKAAINKAIEWNYMGSSPFRGVKQFRLPVRAPRFLTTDEIKRLLLAAKKDRQDALGMAMCFLYTGMRVSELAALRWEDVDFKNGWIRVFGKGQKERHAPIHPKLKAFLKGGEGYIFGVGGKPLSRFTISDVFARLFENAGIRGFRVHDLRHTFASHAVMSGIDLPTVKDILGHTSIQTTMIYSHLARSHIQNSIKKYGFSNTSQTVE